MTDNLYPHESIWLPFLVFAVGAGMFFYKFIVEFLYPPEPLSVTGMCYTQSVILPPYVEFNWFVIFGIALMVLALTMLLGKTEDTPLDIKKQIKQHEDAIVKLRGRKK